ncbi:hypothetical protein ACHAQA_003675 [Verticillium albo-atrum]
MIELFLLLPVLLTAAAKPTTTTPTTTATKPAPPDCLLTALSNQDHPCKITEICTDSQASVLSDIDAICLPSRVQLARDAFFSACSARGIDVTVTPTGPYGTSDGSDQAPEPEVMLYAILGAWIVSALVGIFLF